MSGLRGTEGLICKLHFEFEGKMLQSHFSHRAPLLVSSAGLALSLMLCAAPAAAADQASTHPQIDLSQPNYQPAYPAAAQKAGERGTTIVAVYVNAVGNPYKVLLSETSGYADLDRAAVEAVRSWHFVPATKSGTAVSEWTAVGIQFNLSGVTQVPVSDETKFAQAERNRVVCKAGIGVTGSNIAPPSTCLPKWQWDERENADQKTMSDAVRRTGVASH
jgi:protein TonB